jgi:hypothetical protein
LIRTGHIDTTRLRVGVICRQRTAPRKGIGFARLPWGKRDTGHVLATAIVDRIPELDRPTMAVGRDMNGGLVCHGHVRTAAYARN